MKKFSTDKRGRLTLEAAIVFPFFLTLIFLLINFINVCMVYIAIDHAVSETAKQIATHAYPLYYLDKVKPSGVEDLAMKILTNPDSVNASLPEQLKAAVISDVTTTFGNHLKEFSGGFIEPVVMNFAEKKIREFYPLGSIGENSFTIVNTTMYNPFNVTGSNGKVHEFDLNNEDVTLVVEYKVKLPGPFFQKEITLSNTAVERAWVDDK